MKKLYKYRFVGIFNEPGAGHMKYRLRLDQGARINEESAKRKLAKINKERKKEKLKPLRELPDHLTILVAINKLIRMHREGRIIGNIPEIVKIRLGLGKRKARADKGTERKIKPRRDLSEWDKQEVKPFPEPPVEKPEEKVKIYTIFTD